MTFISWFSVVAAMGIGFICLWPKFKGDLSPQQLVGACICAVSWLVYACLCYKR